MTEQLILSSFSQKTISFSEATKGLRPWNNLMLDWEVEYQGFSNGEMGEPQGYIDFHVAVEIVEALIRVKDQKTKKKIDRAGYKLIVLQNMALEGKEWESYIVYDEPFKKDEIKKAFDVFQREILNIQSWVEIAESRARLIPSGKAIFECWFCGWVTDKFNDDITCFGCGKRFWSDKLWRGEKHENL
jgi:hypothetical protein